MSVARSLALVQLVIVAMGFLGLQVLGRLENPGDHVGILAVWIALATNHGLLLFAVPMLWVVFAAVAANRIPEQQINVLAVIITAALLILLTVPMVALLR